MPHRTLGAAVEAAMTGRGANAEDFDTQECDMWQDEVLEASSSPIKQSSPLPQRTPSPAHTTPEQSAVAIGAFRKPALPLSAAIDRYPKLAPYEDHQARQRSLNANVDADSAKETSNPSAACENDVRSSPPLRDQIFHFKRDAQGQFQLPARIQQPFHGSPSRIGRMDRDGMINSTQKSSLTQEHSASVFERYATAEQFRSSANVYEDARDSPSNHTPHTYDENDTGHIMLDLAHESEKDGDEPESQDASYAAPIPFSSQPLALPQTPAPPTNPFKNKGSVLREQVMFEATQPSSIGRYMASPTSSRPSPNAFNETPLHFPAIDSPLVQRQQMIEDTPNQPSSLFAQTVNESPLPTIGRSMDVSKFSNQKPEPRRYNSMKASQEKREPQCYELSSDDSDIEAEKPNRSRALHKHAVEQLSKVTISLHRKPKLAEPPSSSYTSAIEVPSTGRRRRSLQEDYVAQCDGFDARDTQQKDDYIADSQAPSSPPRHSSAPLMERTEFDEVVPDEAIAATQSAATTQASYNETDRHVLPLGGDATLEQSSKEESTSSLPSTQAPAAAVPGANLDDKLASAVVPVTAQPAAKTSSEEPLAMSDSTSSLPPTQAAREAVPEVSSENQLPPNFPTTTPVHEGHHDNSSLPSTQALPVSLHPNNELDLPLRELCANPTMESTSPKAQLSSGSEQLAIPETSPLPELNLRPIGDIGVSFVADREEDMSTPPGFSQDAAFEAVLKMNASSPKKVVPARQRSQPNSVTSSQPQAFATAIVAEVRTEAIQAAENVSLDRSASTDNVPATGRVENAEISNPPQQDVVMDDEPLFVPDNAPQDVADEAGIDDNPVLEDAEIDDADTVHLDSSMVDENIKEPPVQVKKRATRRSLAKVATPTPSALSTTSSELSSISSSAFQTPQSTPIVKGPASSTRTSVTRSSSVKPGPVADPPKATEPRRNSKRKAIGLEETSEPTRSSKRRSLACVSRSSSVDPLSLPSAFTGGKASSGLFSKMVFAVSYDPKNEKEKEKVKKCIEEQGGRLLEPGFMSLFTTQQEESGFETKLNKKNRGLKFAAVIADDFSRKPKYLEALALGLPCLSGQWILACIAKEQIMEWSPYLLCAGKVEYLNDAHVSRKISSYPAELADLASTLEGRTKVFYGKSILTITSRAESEAQRGKTIEFLLQASGPARYMQVSSIAEARKHLEDNEAEGRAWDFIFCYGNTQVTEKALFTSAGGKKKKRGSSAPASVLPLSKVRMLVDKEVFQSVITGRWIGD
ncbi:hypothetical protein HYFRA_00010848 [Hymenoscyphus fraxineus]|uniref:BRCT domain-containing protein n=1 Tax=Hymenoscyphus fraxineus TaxID=746836 RepID=A0A9N9PTV1_9HELO|nr:hypothetical protein HYFRA_00010848 [Hymenoscyphus fraxineus]